MSEVGTVVFYDYYYLKNYFKQYLDCDRDLSSRRIIIESIFYSKLNKGVRCYFYQII